MPTAVPAAFTSVAAIVRSPAVPWLRIHGRARGAIGFSSLKPLMGDEFYLYTHNASSASFTAVSTCTIICLRNPAGKDDVSIINNRKPWNARETSS